MKKSHFKYIILATLLLTCSTSQAALRDYSYTNQIKQPLSVYPDNLRGYIIQSRNTFLTPPADSWDPSSSVGECDHDVLLNQNIHITPDNLGGYFINAREW